MWQAIKRNLVYICMTVVIVATLISTALMPQKKPEPLKDYKDGIQNHLVWNIKGECFFVRPNDDITVYLIRVQDCDKK